MGGPGEFSSPSGGGCGGTGRQRPAEGFSIYRFSTQTRFSEDTEPGCLGLLLEIHRTAPPLKVKASRSIPESGGSSEGRGTRPRPGLGGWRRPGGEIPLIQLWGGSEPKAVPVSLAVLPTSGCSRLWHRAPPPHFLPAPTEPPGGCQRSPGQGSPGGMRPPSSAPPDPPRCFRARFARASPAADGCSGAGRVIISY